MKHWEGMNGPHTRGGSQSTSFLPTRGPVRVSHQGGLVVPSRPGETKLRASLDWSAWLLVWGSSCLIAGLLPIRTIVGKGSKVLCLRKDGGLAGTGMVEGIDPSH